MYTGGLLSLSLRVVMWRRGGSGWALGAEASAYSNEGVESPSPLVGLLTAKQRQFYMKDQRLRIMRLLKQGGSHCHRAVGSSCSGDLGGWGSLSLGQPSVQLSCLS